MVAPTPYISGLYLKIRPQIYNSGRTINPINQVAGLSSFYLSRVFRAEVGVSIQRYQIQVRIDRAKRLLTQGLPIWQVAIAAGFVDQSHFTHKFRQIVRTTPGRYRSGRTGIDQSL
jgi:AraC-like DNA-binding protein